jgi:hypothetical protein
MSSCWQNACQMHKMAVRFYTVAGIRISPYKSNDRDGDSFQISGYRSVWYIEM